MLDILWEYGFILGYRQFGNKDFTALKHRKNLQVFFKVWGSKSVLQNLKIVSRPQKRVFLQWRSLTRIFNKHELIILSTNKGVLSHYSCLKHQIGGEVLCVVG